MLPSLPPRLLPVDEDAERELRKRTLTNLYNTRPAWLAHLHTTLDAAVFAAYGWAEAVAPGGLGEEELLSRLLALNLERAWVDSSRIIAIMRTCSFRCAHVGDWAGYQPAERR